MDALRHEKDAAETVALVKALLDRPGHHRLVAHVLVDLAARLQDRLGDVVEEVVLEVVEAERAQRRRDRGGVVQIEEHEDAILRDGPVIPAQQETHQRSGTEHPVELADEVDEEARQREDGQRHQESATQDEILVLLGRVVREQAPVLGEPQHAHRHDVDDGRAQGDVEEGPDEEEAAHGQGAHVARDQTQLEPRAAEPDDRAGGRRGEFPGEVRGHPPDEPVHEHGRSDPAARDPQGGPGRVEGPRGDHGSDLDLDPGPAPDSAGQPGEQVAEPHLPAVLRP